ncbi:MAG: hypothetical protein P1V18_00645 [Candidatus Gracilibacteria bacterium]|nr:hypothetical protein [Candidatus Gracilibacteria bacterium]
MTTSAVLEQPKNSLDEKNVKKLVMKYRQKERKKLLKGLHGKYREEGQAKIKGQNKQEYSRFADEKIRSLVKKLGLDDEGILKKEVHKILWNELQNDIKKNVDAIRGETNKKVKALLEESKRTSKSAPSDSLMSNAKSILQQVVENQGVKDELYYELSQEFDKGGAHQDPGTSFQDVQKVDAILYRLSRKKGLKKAVWDLMNIRARQSILITEENNKPKSAPTSRKRKVLVKPTQAVKPQMTAAPQPQKTREPFGVSTKNPDVKTSWFGNAWKGVKNFVWGEEKQEKTPTAPESATAIIKQIEEDYPNKLDAREIKAKLLTIIQDFFDGETSIEQMKKRSKKADLEGKACLIIVRILNTKYKQTSNHILNLVLNLIVTELEIKEKGGAPLPLQETPPNKPKKRKSGITIEPIEEGSRDEKSSGEVSPLVVPEDKSKQEKKVKVLGMDIKENTKAVENKIEYGKEYTNEEVSIRVENLIEGDRIDMTTTSGSNYAFVVYKDEKNKTFVRPGNKKTQRKFFRELDERALVSKVIGPEKKLHLDLGGQTSPIKKMKVSVEFTNTTATVRPKKNYIEAKDDQGKAVKALGVENQAVVNPKVRDLSEEQLIDLREGLIGAKRAVDELEEEGQDPMEIAKRKGAQQELYEGISPEQLDLIRKDVRRNLDDALKTMDHGGKSEDLQNTERKRNEEAVKAAQEQSEAVSETIESIDLKKLRINERIDLKMDNGSIYRIDCIQARDQEVGETYPKQVKFYSVSLKSSQSQEFNEPELLALTKVGAKINLEAGKSFKIEFLKTKRDKDNGGFLFAGLDEKSPVSSSIRKIAAIEKSSIDKSSYLTQKVKVLFAGDRIVLKNAKGVLEVTSIDNKTGEVTCKRLTGVGESEVTFENKEELTDPNVISNIHKARKQRKAEKAEKRKEELHFTISPEKSITKPEQPYQLNTKIKDVISLAWTLGRSMTRNERVSKTNENMKFNKKLRSLTPDVISTQLSQSKVSMGKDFPESLVYRVMEMSKKYERKHKKSEIGQFMNMDVEGKKLYLRLRKEGWVKKEAVQSKANAAPKKKKVEQRTTSIFEELGFEAGETVEFQPNKRTNRVLATVKPHETKKKLVVVTEQKSGEVHRLNLKSAQKQLSKVPMNAVEEPMMEAQLTRSVPSADDMKKVSEAREKRLKEEVTAAEAPQTVRQIDKKYTKEDAEGLTASDREILTEQETKEALMKNKPLEGEPLTLNAALRYFQILKEKNTLILNTEQYGQVKIAKTPDGNIKFIEGSVPGINKYQAYTPKQFEKVSKLLSKVRLIGNVDMEKLQELPLNIKDREYIQDWDGKERMKTGERFSLRKNNKSYEFTDGQLATYVRKSDQKEVEVRVFKSPAKDEVILKPEGDMQQFALWTSEAFDRLKPTPVKEKNVNSENKSVQKKKKKASRKVS